MAAGPTTRAFVDKNNETVNSVGGQNANGDYVTGSTAHDINGNPISVALDSSVQELATALALIITNTTGVSTATAQAAANAALTTIATNTAGLATDAHMTALISALSAELGPLATDAHLVSILNALTAALPLPTGAATSALQSTGNTTLAAILTRFDTLSAVANTVGGASTYSAVGGTGNALLTATLVAIKASGGNLYGFDFVNTGATDAYVQFFDLAAGGVTLGTTVPKLSKWVPSGGAWEEKFSGEAKVTFATAITIAATATPTGNGAPATGILANILFK